MDYQEEFEALDSELIAILDSAMPEAVRVDRLATYDMDDSGVIAGLLVGTDGKGYAFEIGEESVKVGVVKKAA